MMVRRVLASASVGLCKSHHVNPSTKNFPFFSRSLPRRISFIGVLCKDFTQMPAFRPGYDIKGFPSEQHPWIHSGSSLKNVEVVGPLGNSEKNTTADGTNNSQMKRKRPKGKRAVIKWLKFFRWKKKKEYKRMTAEEKILYKLGKARKKEERLVQALQKIEPAESSETTHDPEVLTPEEHFYFLKMGLKCKNYVPVGVRGIYQGVILNMHLHWKKHQTLQVIVKTFSPEEVKEIAADLARLTGGIVLDIHEENIIIMYRGKNYTQPPTEIMSPRVTLSRKKALDKSKHKDALRAVRKYIPRLEQDLELLRSQAKSKAERRKDSVERTPENNVDCVEPLEKLEQVKDEKEECSDDDPALDFQMTSDSEDLSDTFETDLDTETEETAKHPLYLDAFEKFPVEGDGEPEDFDKLCQISEDSEKTQSSGKDVSSPTFDEVDRMFIRVASLLKKKR